MKKLLKFLLVLVIPLNLWSQSVNNPQRSYLHAKDLYNSGQYALALQAFKPLTTYSNDFAEYATYFYGLSAYYDGQQDIARNIFLQLIRKYPNWTKKNEAQLWLTKMYFEQEEYSLAMQQLEQIRDRSLSSQATAIKSQYLPMADLSTLKELHHQYPSDPEIATNLAKKLSKSLLTEADQDQLKWLIQRFNLKESEINDQVVSPTVMKDRYRVAVLFPFMTNDIKNERKFNSNQWVLDLYDGIKFGYERLKAAGKNIELYAYDTGRDSVTTAEILQRDEMLTMDLIIGPLYAQPSKLVEAFSMEHQVNILNPLSSNSAIIANNPYSFLFHPGDKTASAIAANFMIKQMDPKKKALIIYGSRPGDSVRATTYQKILEDKEIETIVMDPIPTADAEEIARFITDNLTGILLKDNENLDETIGHVYVASNEELIIANVIGNIDNLGAEVSIMGNENWLWSRYIDFNQLERMGVYMTMPGYIDYESDDFHTFQRRYVARTGAIPTRFSIIGYELITFFGQMLQDGGTYFQHSFKDHKFYPGQLYRGFGYQDHRDNQHVPIVTFNEGKLQLVNQ